MIFSREVNCSGTCTWKWGDKGLQVTGIRLLELERAEPSGTCSDTSHREMWTMRVSSRVSSKCLSKQIA